MTQTLIVRPTDPTDLAAITAIYAVEVLNGTASFETEPPDETEMGRRLVAVTAAGLPHRVAELEGRVVGYAYAGPYRPRAAYARTVENSVYVARGVHRCGVGRVLLTAVIDECAAAGKCQMVAVIGDRENHASIGLHAALGFCHVGVLSRVGFKFGRWIDSVLMQRAL